MRRGTTPTHYFIVDVDLRDAEEIFITYARNVMPDGSIIRSDCLCLHDAVELEESRIEILLEKELEDITVEEDKLTTRLTQEETMRFRDDDEVMIQIAAKFADDSVIRSNIMTTDVQRILKEEVI